MIEIKISADSPAELRAQLAHLYSAFVGPVQPANDTPVVIEQPAKRTRVKKADAPAEQPATTERTGVVQQASAPIVKANESLFATTEALAPAPEKLPEQKDLITAFRALNEKKGTDAIVGLLGKFGAKTVALIPKDKWAEAIAAAQGLAA